MITSPRGDNREKPNYQMFSLNMLEYHLDKIQDQKITVSYTWVSTNNLLVTSWLSRYKDLHSATVSYFFSLGMNIIVQTNEEV